MMLPLPSTAARSVLIVLVVMLLTGAVAAIVAQPPRMPVLSLAVVVWMLPVVGRTKATPPPPVGVAPPVAAVRVSAPRSRFTALGSPFWVTSTVLLPQLTVVEAKDWLIAPGAVGLPMIWRCPP